MLEVNKVYGDLLCVSFSHMATRSHAVYLMRCTKCGREKLCKDYVVRRGSGTSHKACGKGIKTLDPVFYHRWCSMRNRTENDNYWASKYYKDKGITSDEFEYFIDFYDAMYDSYKECVSLYGEHNTSLDRIDSNLPYSKSNCRWVCLKEQSGNTSRNRVFEAKSPDGTIYTERNVTKFCREHDLDRGSVSNILNGVRTSSHKGWSFRYL